MEEKNINETNVEVSFEMAEELEKALKLLTEKQEQ
mgnify:CR=1 FL=1|jgi:hypothetical protein